MDQLQYVEGRTDEDLFVRPREDESTEDKPDTTLTDNERETFQSLLTLGKLTKTVDVLGHPVVLETLTVADELLVGMETKEYRDTEAFARAYQSAVVASSVRQIDGTPLYIPLSSSESKSEIFHKKLEKVHTLYPLVVSEMYRAYVELEKSFAELADKLGKLPG